MDDTKWSDVADIMADIVGSRGCALLVTQAGEGLPWQLNAMSRIWRDIPPEVFKYYYENYSRYERPAFELLQQRPKFIVKTSDEGLSDVDDFPRDREDVRYYIANTGCHHRAAFRLNDNPGWFDTITFQYSEKLRKVPREGLQSVLEYLPHLAKALDVRRMYRLLSLRYDAILTAFDHVRVGLLVVLASGEIIVINRRAEAIVSEGDGIRRSAGGGLRFHDLVAGELFHAGLIRITNTARGVGRKSCVTLLASRPSGKTPFLIELTPLRDPLKEIDLPHEGVLVTLIDPCSKNGVDMMPLSLHAGLTASERDVCERFARGISREQIAVDRGTSANTVKSQVRSIFSKCRVGTRLELIRLAARLSPPVGPMAAKKRL